MATVMRENLRGVRRALTSAFTVLLLFLGIVVATYVFSGWVLHYFAPQSSILVTLVVWGAALGSGLLYSLWRPYG